MILTARYVLPVSSAWIEDGAVLVHGDKIEEVDTREALVARYPDEELRDFGLATIAPGFVDAHTHLEYTVLRGLIDDLPYARWKHAIMRREPLLAAPDWDDSALLGGLEALASGITTIADSSRTGASLRAAAALGLRGLIYREVETMEKALVGQVMESALADIEAWEADADPNLLAIGISPHSPYSCHPELFQRVAEYAADGRAVTLHLAGSREERQFIKYGSSLLGFDVREEYDRQAPLWLPTGVSPVRYVLQWDLFKVPNISAVHCTQVDKDDIDILARYKVGVAHCPRCNAKLGMGVMPLQDLLDAGISVGLGTDSAAATNTIGMFEEMRTGLLMQRAVARDRHFFAAADFLRFATLGSAEVLGIDGEVGSLEPGKKADVVVVDMSRSHQVPTVQPESAFVHTAARANVMLTMVGGRVLYENGSWKSADEKRVYARNEEIRAKLRV